MQGGIAHQHASNMDRLQTRHRRNRPGAAHLELHVPDEGHLLLCRELKGHGPARRAGDETQLFLQGQRIDFDHHAINVKAQVGTLFLDFTIVSKHNN